MKKCILLFLVFISAVNLYGQQKVAWSSLKVKNNQSQLYQEFDENENVIYSKSEVHYEDGSVSSRLIVNYYSPSNKLVRTYVANNTIPMIRIHTYIEVSGELKERSFMGSISIKRKGVFTALDVLVNAYKDGELLELTTKYNIGNMSLDKERSLDSAGRIIREVSYDSKFDTAMVETFQYFEESSKSVQHHYVNRESNWENYTIFNAYGDDLQFIQINNNDDTSYISAFRYDAYRNLINETAGKYVVNYSYELHKVSNEYVCVKELHIQKGKVYKTKAFEFDERGNLIRAEELMESSGEIEETIWENQYFD